MHVAWSESKASKWSDAVTFCCLHSHTLQLDTFSHTLLPCIDFSIRDHIVTGTLCSVCLPCICCSCRARVHSHRRCDSVHTLVYSTLSACCPGAHDNNESNHLHFTPFVWARAMSNYWTGISMASFHVPTTLWNSLQQGCVIQWEHGCCKDSSNFAFYTQLHAYVLLHYSFSIFYFIILY